MIDAELLQDLCCPATHQSLQVADAALIAKLNLQIDAGALQNRAGQPVKARIDGGLVCADGKFLYPQGQNIPVLLVAAAIPL